MNVAIRGIGCVSGSGRGVESLWSAILNDQTAVSNGLGRISAENASSAQLSFTAIEEAMKQADWDTFDGLILATTTGQISLWESPWFQFFQNQIDVAQMQAVMKNQPLGSLTKIIAEKYSCSGPTALLTSACSASTQAIALAAMWIKQKRAKRVLVGGVEILSQLTVEGFKSLQLLSDKPSTPFSKNRVGINLSEASAFLCLEDSNQGLAYLTGHGFSTDAYHITSPHPEGKGIYQSMQMALSSAGLQPSDITYVHAHATGSPANDSAESIAIHVLFDQNGPTVSATKSIHGHALAASGTLEAILCVKSLQENIELKTFGVTELDPSLRVNVSFENKKKPIKHILKNTLGFGGNNASLVFSKDPQ